MTSTQDRASRLRRRPILLVAALALAAALALGVAWLLADGAPGSASRTAAPCQHTAEFWATSQAAPVRRVEFNGFISLMDYCSKPSYSSGGFIADSKFSGKPVLNGSQQQFPVRNSTLDGWSNSVWNQVFSG